MITTFMFDPSEEGLHLERIRAESTEMPDHFSAFLPINLDMPCDVTCTTARQRVVSDDGHGGENRTRDRLRG